MPIGRNAGRIVRAPGGAIGKSVTTTTGPVQPCGEGGGPSLEFTVTGIDAANRDGTDGGGDYINWVGKKWYNNVSQIVCPTTTYESLEACLKAYGATNTLYYPANQLWQVTGSGGQFRIHAQTGGTVECASPSASPCLPLFVPISGILQHNGAASFNFVRQVSAYKATCAPAGFNTPAAFPPVYISSNIATGTTMYWFGLAQIPTPVTGTVTSTQGISISWQEGAGW